MNKVFAQVRDMFKKNNFVAERDVVEEDEMLMKLAHVADVRHDGNAKFARKQTDGDKLADSRHAHSVHLDESGAFRLQIIFENDAVGNVLAQSEFGRRNGVGKCFVAEHIVWMRRFFNPKWIDGAQPLANV